MNKTMNEQGDPATYKWYGVGGSTFEVISQNVPTKGPDNETINLHTSQGNDDVATLISRAWGWIIEEKSVNVNATMVLGYISAITGKYLEEITAKDTRIEQLWLEKVAEHQNAEVIYQTFNEKDRRIAALETENAELREKIDDIENRAYAYAVKYKQ